MPSTRLRPLAILRPVMATGLLLLSAALLAGCGAGQQTQTAMHLSAVDGAEGQIGPIAVRNAQLAYPEGGEHLYRRGEDAPLTAVIVNTSTTGDELTSARSPAAEMVQIEGQRVLPGQRTLRAVAPSAAPTPTTPSRGATEPSSQKLSQGQVRITLVSLAQDVSPGKTIRLTLLFRQAGELTLDLPVGPPGSSTT